MDSSHEHKNPFASPLADDAPPSAPGWQDAERIRQKHLLREASIKALGVLFYFGVAASLFGMLSLAVAVIADGGVGPSSVKFPAIWLFILPAAWVAYTAAYWWIARGFCALNPVVRPWPGGLAALGIVLGLLAFNPITLLVCGYLLWLPLGKKGKYVFSPEYKGVIKATPQCKRPLVVRVLLIVLLVVLALVIVPAVISGAWRVL